MPRTKQSSPKQRSRTLRLGAPRRRLKGLVFEPAEPLRVTPGAPPSLLSTAPDAEPLARRVERAPAPLKLTVSRALKPENGASVARNRAAFAALAQRDDVPGAAGVLTVKFLMVGADKTRPTLYLMNTKRYAYHYDFATRALGMKVSLATFNRETYFTDKRKNIAGQILAYDEFVGEDGKKGLYTIEFWPTDPVKAPHVAKVYRAAKTALPFAASALRYHPAGDTQEALYAKEAGSLRRRRVKSILTKELFEGVVYSPLNLGVGYGLLTVFDGSSRPPSVRDVIIFKSVPNDLGRVAGILTDAPQTPLSHINLKAKQDKTPNAYVKDASADPRIAPLVGKLVRYEVRADGFDLREATAAEVEAALESLRPKNPQVPSRDLGPKDAVRLESLRHRDVKAFGAKTANVAELATILPAGTVPRGFGVPFFFYDTFMKSNGLYEQATKMMAAPSFFKDIAVREEKLKKLRKAIKDAPVPGELMAKIAAVHAAFPATQPLRCRSSTNNEDLVGFNGAGLYDSYTHRPDEGELGKTLQQVWASTWNLRAFDERDFYRVDQLAAAMGVLIHPNQDDELANGVAITRNIYDPSWPGFYVNAQVGESLVTNPDPGAVPDEFLISAIGPNGEYEIQFIRHSSLVEEGRAVLSAEDITALVRAMESIQAHFKRVYGRDSDPTFAMDIEFKIDRDGSLIVKQARPVVS
jgi:pyruvate, water dikinase